jgi:uncharacterized Ntn-hydrolase superfamily protein
MTWSIVARDPATGAFGIAVTTKFFAVGALVPYLRAGVGAVATQALVNPLYGSRGIALLEDELPAAAVVRRLIEADDGRETRQVHILDREGRNAAHTGADCIPWAGHTLRDGFSVAGNMLAGPAVIADTAAAYERHAALPFAERLIAALDAGQAAGGDKRGKQSAALAIHSAEDYPDLSIRVDDHPEPLAELRRLYEESRRVYEPYRQFMPTRANPSGIWDRAVINEAIARAQAALEKQG